MSEALQLPARDAALDELAPAQRQHIARSWARRSVQEAHAAAVFEQLLPRIEEQDLRPEVLALARKAAVDEHRHARICALAARRYDPMLEMPPPLALTQVRDEGLEPKRVLLYQLVGSSAVSETIGAFYLEAALREAQSAVARHVLRQLLKDEIDHSRLGWAYLSSEAVDDLDRVALAAALPHILNRIRNLWRSPHKDMREDPPPGHGQFGLTALHSLVDTALSELVLPGLDAVGVNTSQAQRWFRGAQ